MRHQRHHRQLHERIRQAARPTGGLQGCREGVEARVVILDQAITGEIGNGKVSVLTAEDAMRVRTGKTGDTCLG
jgi:hypothetical protein